MTLQRLALVALTLGTCGCASVVDISPTTRFATVAVRVQTPFSLKAKPAVTTDVHHYTFKLIRTSDSTVLRTGASSNLSTQFTAVPDGAYRLSAEAFSSKDDTASVTQGGPQLSGNTVTVASSGSGPFVTYSDAGTALTVTVNLLDGTGESVANQLTVNNGAAYAGPIGFVP